MPLPAAGIAWPPTQMTAIAAKQAELDAWYSGDAGRLANTYTISDAAPAFDRTSQHRGGVVGTLARMWWGAPTGSLFQKNTVRDKLHIPLAGDICEAGADLLYADPPQLTAKNKTTREELDLAVEQGVLSAMANGAEVGAALGDSYFRVTWDRDLRDRSFITPVNADAAWPRFKWGILTEVTFWWVVRRTDTTVWRHLEHHEVLNGVGIIYHGLYEGTNENLGKARPLAEDPSTKDLQVNGEQYISTETPGLAVEHVPNKLPQRQWRHHPVGCYLGRSDLAGAEPELDKLDMVWSSWMRDIRLAKARLIVPNFMLSSGRPGEGSVFDTDQDVFTTLNAPPREDGQAQITPQQFLIRVADHQATADALVAQILRSAGYGAQTFGMAGDVAQTATEVDARDRRSANTRDRKIRSLKAPLTRLLQKKLRMDARLFATGVADVELEVNFPESNQATPEALARTNQLLFAGQTASAQVRVALQHPDWDETQVKEEAARILEEFGASVPDPVEVRPPEAEEQELDEEDPEEQDPEEEQA